MTQQQEDVSDKIALIMGQTNYSADDAGAKLKSKNYDELAVIREYLGVATGGESSTSNAHPQSKNQLIYTEIRKFMDGCGKADTTTTTPATDNSNSAAANAT